MEEGESGRSNTSSVDASVTRWLTELEQGDESAARQLWEFLRRRLLQIAHKEIARSPQAVYDQEDVALSAFDALCRVVQEKRYALADRDELCRVVAVIAVNKARNRALHEGRFRRGGGKRVDGEAFLRSIVSPDPPADIKMIMEEECQRLLGRLKKRDVQLVALLKVEGYTNEEVAERLGCTRRSVQRRLAMIRNIWREEVA